MLEVLQGRRGESVNLVDIRDLSFTFDGRREILKNIDIDIKRGETLGIMGESGSGKSTLAGCIAGLHKGYRGSIEYAPPIEAGRKHIEGVHLIFQDPYSSLNPKLQVWKAVGEGALIRGKKSDSILLEGVCEVLDEVGLPREYAHRRIEGLSGGERQKVAIARALILTPSLIIFDEATVNLDLISQRDILFIMKNLKKKGHTMVVISHDEALLRLLSHRIVQMEEGQIIKFEEI